MSYGVLDRSVNDPRDTRGDLSVTDRDRWHERNVRYIISHLKKKGVQE